MTDRTNLYYDGELVFSTTPYKCKKCSQPLIRKPKMFHWRGQYFSGLVCTDCNALFDDSEDSFAAGVKKGRS